MLDSNLEDMSKCLVKMKRKINKFWFLLGAISVSSTPIIASSCVYENHPSVIYAKEFVNSNYWKNNKEKIEKKVSPLLVNEQIKMFYNKMIKEIKLQATFNSYDIFTPENQIEIDVTGMSEEQIQSLLHSIDLVVKAVLEDTPFYSLYLMSKNSILKHELNKVIFNYKKGEALYNYILASDFLHLLKQYKYSSDKSIANVYKNIVFDYFKNKPFSFAAFSPYYNEYKQEMLVTYSMVTGFGPVYILRNTDKIGNSSDETKVFAQELANSTELSEEFMNSPVEFVEEHPDLLYYDSYHGEISRVKAGKSLYKKDRSDKMINETLVEIEEIAKIAQKYRELKAVNNLEEAQKIKTEMFNYINNSKYLKSSYKKQIEYVKAKKSETISNIYHYVEIYALSLFLLGYENIELISLNWPEGIEQNNFNKTNLRYFVLKITDSNGQTKYLDPYRDYMKYTEDKNYEYGKVYDNIPEGFTISEEFK